ncbi:MAG: signal transduction histidine kinase [Akkermansiaceae bacterium]|jgi:signal transduction histidine kinase
MFSKDLLLIAILLPELASARGPFSSRSDSIQQDIEQLETELGSLATSPVNSSPWTLGYSSTQSESPTLPIIIEIMFPQTAEIDLVALLPATFTDDQNQLQPFGFPLRFSIERFLPDGSSELIADHRESDYPFSDIEPRLFPCPNPVPTRGLKITVTKLSTNPTWWPASHAVALSEVFAFADEQNSALGSKVKTTSSLEFSYFWGANCLTDGFSLFSPIDHKPRNPQRNFTTTAESVALQFDLGKKRLIDELHLWPVAYSQHNFPASSGIGFPREILLEGATQSDYSDRQTLFKKDSSNIRPGAGPFMKRIDPTEIRYLRLTLKNGLPDFRRKNRPVISLTEIEFLEKGRVISRGLRPRIVGAKKPSPMLEQLTDGNSNEGSILAMRDWIIQFKRRVELERKLDSLRQDFTETSQKEERFSEIALLVALGTVALLLLIIWLVRISARRRWSKVRERIACDLHDEVGANVSSIAHTAELLHETIPQPSETQTRLLTNLIESARLTSRETKHFISFIEGENHELDLSEQFNKVADQILGTIPLTTSYDNIRSFNQLEPDAKWNLLLFLKEALNNIIKHAQATKVQIATKRISSNLHLDVKDNGQGLPEGTTDCRHLSQRAKLLGGTLDITSESGKGTRTSLTFKK